MWTHGSGEPGFRLLSVICVVAVVACGDEGGTSDGGICDPGVPEVPSSSDAEVQGSIRVQDRVVIVMQDGQPVEQIQSIFSGGFQRNLTEGVAAQFLPLGTQCVGLVSLPVRGDFEMLDGGPLELNAALGSESVAPDDENVYRSIVPGDRRLDEGSDLSVTGGGSAFEFPGFSMSILAPDPLRLSSPSIDGSAVLPTSDLEFRWAPGNGELVIVDISPQPPPTSGGKVQCFFVDDGCGVVPASATTFLRASNTPTYAVVVSRVRDDRVTLEEEVTMDLTASSVVQFELPPGDGR